MSAPLFISLYTPVKVPLWVQITLGILSNAIRLYTDFTMLKTGYFRTL